MNKLSIFILLLFILQNLSSLIVSAQGLLSLVESAAGVYIHPDDHRQFYTSSSIFDSLNKIVIVSAFNYGYHSHILNFKCFLDRLNMKALILAADKKAYSVADSLKPNLYTYYLNSSMTGYNLTSNNVEEASYFRETTFNIISFLKMEVVYNIMEYGYHVVFIDSDVAVIRDPLPNMIYENVDYSFAINLFCPNCYRWNFYRDHTEGNTGVYYVRSTNSTLSLWKKVLLSAQENLGMDDQTVFWKEIRRNRDHNQVILSSCSHQPSHISDSNPYPLVACPLDGCMYVMGGFRIETQSRLASSLKEKNLKLILIHANYLMGHEAKQQALKKHGYWITKYPSPGCDEYKGEL